MYNMSKMKGNGTQKEARLARLKNEIVEYVSTQDSCSAADSVHHLSNERRMRNHGLTARKGGFSYRVTYRTSSPLPWIIRPESDCTISRHDWSAIFMPAMVMPQPWNGLNG